MVNNPLFKALFLMGVPYMGVGWLVIILVQCSVQILGSPLPGTRNDQI